VHITTELQNVLDLWKSIDWQGGAANPKLGKRVLWFAAIYVASVAVFAVVAALLSMIVPH
jgi:hypothetical protein